jgi:hypothetical protein
MRRLGVEYATEGVPLPNPLMALDIDRPEDLELAERIVRDNRFDFELSVSDGTNSQPTGLRRSSA